MKILLIPWKYDQLIKNNNNKIDNQEIIPNSTIFLYEKLILDCPKKKRIKNMILWFLFFYFSFENFNTNFLI